jgi:hypothetical protein
MKKDYIIGIYEDEEALIKGAKGLREKNVEIEDFYTPFPVHGLDELLGIKRSILPYVTLAAGALGLSLALLMQIWMSEVSWPVVIGGKPFNSIPAFIPVSFELTILFGAHTTVAAFFAINKLWPGKKEQLFDQGQTESKFIIAIDKSKTNLDEASSIMKSAGAIEVKEGSQDV